MGKAWVKEGTSKSSSCRPEASPIHSIKNSYVSVSGEDVPNNCMYGQTHHPACITIETLFSLEAKKSTKVEPTESSKTNASLQAHEQLQPDPNCDPAPSILLLAAASCAAGTSLSVYLRSCSASRLEEVKLKNNKTPSILGQLCSEVLEIK